MDAFFGWLVDTASSLTELQRKLLSSLVLCAVFWGLRLVALRVVHGRTDDPKTLYQWRKALTYSAVALAFVTVGRIWFEGFQSLSTFLGLLTAGLAIALQDPIVNLAGWVFLIVRKPFKVGDRIQIGEHRGDVIDIRIFQFSLLEIGNWVDADQSTGRVIHVPNGRIFREAQANYTEGFEFIWNEIAVLVTFESNWQAAKQLLREIGERHAEHLSADAKTRVRQAAQKYMIFYKHLSPTVYTSVLDSGVNLTIRYLCNPRRRRASTNEIWEAILTAFAERQDIDFAYPTTRFYRNDREGKPGTMPQPANPEPV